MDTRGTLNIAGTDAMYDFDYSGSPWYDYRNNIKQIYLSEGLTVVGKDAFRGCYAITEIAIPNTVTEIHSTAFIMTGLTQVTFPDGLHFIGNSAFSSCSGLTAVSIPESVTVIEECAFCGCDLDSVRLSASVSKIGSGAFAGNKNMKNIVVDERNAYYKTDSDGVLYSKDMKTLLQCPGGISGSYTIPAGVTAVGAYCFKDCAELIGVEFPDTVTDLGGQSIFSGCAALTSLVLPDNVTLLDYAFAMGCSNLRSVRLPENLKSIGIGVFNNCGKLAEIFFTGDAPTIAESAFSRVSATAYYPGKYFTWTSGVMKNYGGTIIWEAN